MFSKTLKQNKKKLCALPNEPASFYVSVGYVSFLVKCLFMNFAHLLGGLFDFLVLSCISSLHILDTYPFIGYVICKYLLPLSSLSFNSVDCFVFCFLFFCCTEAFYFDVVPIVYYSFSFLASGVIS